MSKQGDYEDKAFEALQRLRKVTKMGAAKKEWNLNEHPNIDVYDYSPNLKLDGDNRYKIAGKEWAVILQTSLLQAVHDILGNRLGFTIDFEEWFKDFEYEFYKALPTGKQPPESKLKPWGKDIKNRPKKLNLLDKKKAAEKGYMILRFWPDREAEDSSIILCGTYTELRHEMLKIMRPSGACNSSEGNYSDPISFYGKPMVTLYFVEKSEDIEKGYAPIRSQFSFRLIDKSEDPRSDEEKLTKADIKILANKINELFVKPTPYKLHRGKETISIKDKARGYDSYVHAYTESDGVELFRRICQIQNHVIDLAKVFHKITIDSSKAYPTLPPEVTVLGSKVKEPRRRPVGYCHFTEARLFMGLVSKPIKLCDSLGFIFSDTDSSV